MTRIQIDLDSDLPAESVLAATRDFSRERLELWPRIDPAVYEVEELDENHAVVREGSDVLGGIWAKERYEWSEDGVVRAEIQDSNVFRTGGTWELRARPTSGEGSHIQITWNRRGKGIKGLLIILMMRLGGRKNIEQGLQEMLALLRRRQTATTAT